MNLESRKAGNTLIALATWLAVILAPCLQANPLILLSGSPPAAGGGGSLVVANAWRNVTGSGTSTAVTVSPTAASLLVVAMAGYNGATGNHAVSDNIDGTTGWVKIGSQAQNVVTLTLWYKQNVPSGITTVTCDGGASTLTMTAGVKEVTGASTTAAFTGGEVATSTSAFSGNPATGSVTNATAASVYIAVVSTTYASNGATLTINDTGTVGTWSLVSSNAEYTSGATALVYSMPSIVVASSASRLHGWATNNAGYAAIIAAFH